ncbi:SRP40, C-terminal domain-containing protein, partial [Fomes fomentarius]
KQRKVNTPFQRIKTDKVTFVDERLKDNRFESRGASETDYGARASRDLIVTRGAGFRKEKNKKKRGSYHGGEITVRLSNGFVGACCLLDVQMQSHSFKFTD